MKKTLLGLSAAALLLSFASCKKDYNCTCSFKVNGKDTSYAYAIPDAKRGDAHDACDKTEDGVRTLYGTDSNCEIGD